MSESRGLIYLIQPDYLIGTNKYKIGCSRSTNLDCCINRYDKSTRYISINECNNPLQIKNTIKFEFYNKCRYIGGYDYFEGNEAQMIRIILDIINKNRE
jgi:hypothetical protein